MCIIKACALVKGRGLQVHLHSTPGYSVNMLFNQVLQEQSNKFFLPNLPSAPLLWSLFPFVLFPSSIFLASKSMYPSNLNLWLFLAAFRFFLAESLEEEAAGDSLEAAAAALAAFRFFLAESLEEEAAGDSFEAAAAALAAVPFSEGCLPAESSEEDSLEAAAAARKAVFFPLFQNFVAVRGSSVTSLSWFDMKKD